VALNGADFRARIYCEFPFDCRQQQSLRCLFPTQMMDNALIMP
jgi:hypothetical protein